MFSETYGRGSSVIVAYHGWAGTHREFAAVGRRLPEPWRLIAPDLPGYGASPALPTTDECSVVAALANHLDEVADAPVVLSGYCSGAVLALLVAQRNRDAVRRLVLIDPFAYMPLYFRIFTLGEFGRRAYRTTFASALGRKVTETVLRLRRSPDSGFMDSFRCTNHDVVLAYLRLLAQVGTPERFRNVTLPVSVLYGERTFAAVRRSVELFRAVWPHLSVHEIPGGGHLMMVHSAREVAAAMIAEGH